MFMKLRNWIDSSKLNYKILSGNKNAFELLKQNPDKIKWKLVSANKSIFKLSNKEEDVKTIIKKTLNIVLT